MGERRSRYCLIEDAHAIEKGIRSEVLGDYLDAGIGDIPGMMAEVWVVAAAVARAKTILQVDHGSAEETVQPEQCL